MPNDLKTAGNRTEKGLVTKLRNPFRNIPLTRVARAVLQTNMRISAIVDARFGVIVDGVSEPSWTRRGCAQARN